uniref:Uncharacterized protein n=1 Tax=Biomphalaria glabrata TaxID=6526 RepID=A0A2C9M958_BIOGL
MRFSQDNLIYLPSLHGCEYGALRAPPIQFPPLTELPDMAETSIILTNGPSTNHLHHQHHHLNNNSLNSGTPNGSMVQDGTNTATSTILTVRMIMQGKEVGSIIGKVRMLHLQCSRM